jgi:hypothetical protein
MAHTVTSTSRVERASHTSGIERVSTGAPRESDDGFDFPPTAYPGRELFTASLFALAIMTFVVWGGWKLISLLWA